ncbi:magnesium transporter MRS2 homolog, mitochondrial isoform X4 [Chiloscyllium plagiosum]|uniref:magnesium transporter MRS2 homolog, mitochondrial isoform X4 n=1 Tax=Chiloscyllium plagiosum TaxID=36176 RepID=UPI001CB7FB2E|nr:magnesium transporter MRS2 homolog, mitochondrial isoform X4 [Chiloscyllium plagiosum]
MEIYGLSRCLLRSFKERVTLKSGLINFSSFKYGSTCRISKQCVYKTRTSALQCGLEIHPQQVSSSRHTIGWRYYSTDSSQTTLVSVVPVFSIMRYDSAGNVSFFERKKTELYQELGLQARDLRFQHLTSINTRNNCIILRMEINFLQSKLNELQPQILETLEGLVDHKQLSIDRSNLHVLLQASKNLSELETDIKVFKETLLEILDEEKQIEELCLSKWNEQHVCDPSIMGINPAEEMELLLESYYRQAEDLANSARELKVLIDDSESIIFINLDSHRNVMMRLNLQLTMGTFSVSLFGILGVAFGMNLESSFEEDPRLFWLITGIMFLGSGLMWRRLLSFLGRHLEPSAPPPGCNISTISGTLISWEDWKIIFVASVFSVIDTLSNQDESYLK